VMTGEAPDVWNPAQQRELTALEKKHGRRTNADNYASEHIPSVVIEGPHGPIRLNADYVREAGQQLLDLGVDNVRVSVAPEKVLKDGSTVPGAVLFVEANPPKGQRPAFSLVMPIRSEGNALPRSFARLGVVEKLTSEPSTFTTSFLGTGQIKPLYEATKAHVAHWVKTGKKLTGKEWMDYVHTYYITNLLSSPKTFNTNLFSTALHLGTQPFSTPFAALMQRLNPRIGQRDVYAPARRRRWRRGCRTWGRRGSTRSCSGPSKACCAGWALPTPC